MYPSRVKQMLTKRSAPQPATTERCVSKRQKERVGKGACVLKTPTGGRRMVMRTIRRAGAASDMIAVDFSSFME